MHKYNNYSNSYAPSAQTIFAKFKDIIELQFPDLPANFISDALQYATNSYTVFLNNNPTVSDQQAEDYFFEVVMSRIDIYKKREHDKLMTLMLSHQRHNTGDYVTGTSSISSNILNVPVDILKSVYKAQSDKFTPKQLRKLPTIFITPQPLYLYNNDEKAVFLAFREKIQRQLRYIDTLAYSWTKNQNHDIQRQIFNLFFDLEQLNLNANVFEKKLIDGIDMIIYNSSLSKQEKYSFMFFLVNIIISKDNSRYCTELVRRKYHMDRSEFLEV